MEGSCSSIPGKAYPPPDPNIFWQITSADDQGWDFCADPTYDSERAAQPNSTTQLLAGLPANVQARVQLQTQAGCTCSPGNWTYYPAQIADGETCLDKLDKVFLAQPAGQQAVAFMLWFQWPVVQRTSAHGSCCG